MAGYRDQILATFRHFAKAVPIEPLLSMTGRQTLFPVYHVVSNEDLPHIKHLYVHKGVKQFQKDLDFLLRHYQPLSYEEIHQPEEVGARRKKPGFFLSFDDGLAEIYTVIAPILLQKGIPAMFFLNSSFVDNKDLFFRYKVSLLIEKIRESDRIADQVSQLLSETGLRNANLVEALLKLRYSDGQVIDNLGQQVGLDFATFLKEKAPYLTTGQIKSLLDQGFYIGGHSMDHPEFQYISEGEQQDQIRWSMDFCVDNFAVNYKSFAFPFTDYGVRKSIIEGALNSKAVDVFFGSAGMKKEKRKRHIQRIPMETLVLDAETILKSEMMYYLLKMPLGKNRIIRT